MILFTKLVGVGIFSSGFFGLILTKIIYKSYDALIL